LSAPIRAPPPISAPKYSDFLKFLDAKQLKKAMFGENNQVWPGQNAKKPYIKAIQGFQVALECAGRMRGTLGRCPQDRL
jgi:hypothetical protein